jgi:hypothetical protein
MITVDSRMGRKPRFQQAALVLVGLALLAGCGSRPRAPALTNEPVYQNSSEGFRFLVPEGWVQTGKAELPPGTVDPEQMLVEYKQLTSEFPASLEVTAVDLPPSTNLSIYLADRLRKPGRWRQRAGAEQITVGGVSATRMSFSYTADKEEQVREVVAFRRGQRVYFFSGTFVAKDERAQQQVREAVNRISWKS